MEVIERENLPEEYKEMMKTESHHNHEIVKINGRYRWKSDSFVERLTEVCNLNNIIVDLLSKGYTKNSEIYRELYRKMGYSLDGYWEVFYWEVNNPDAENYKKLVNANEVVCNTWNSSDVRKSRGSWSAESDTGIQLVHLPTGTVVECESERSSHKNKAKAMQELTLALERL